MALNTDSKIILPFYGLLLLTIFVFLYLLDSDTSTYRIILGAIWTMAGIYTARKLHLAYPVSFWKLPPQTRKFIIIAIIVASFGIFIIFWEVLRKFNQ